MGSSKMAPAEEDSGPSANTILTKAWLDETIVKPLVKGETWYLVDFKWYKACRKYLGFDDTAQELDEEYDHPGPIDNSGLFTASEHDELRAHMIEEMDYILMPQEVWDCLHAKFGLVEGQSPVARVAREFGMFVKHVKVEIYFTELHLTIESQPEKTVKKKFSKADTIGKIVSEMRRVFEVGEDKKIKFWNKYTSTTYEQIT